MMATKKIIDIKTDSIHISVIQIMNRHEMNPYRIYRLYNGHRKQLVKYGDLISVFCFLKWFFQDGLDVITLPEQVEAVKNASVK